MTAPTRTPGSASGNRIRIGTGPVTNWGDEADLVVAFNEQALLANLDPKKDVEGIHPYNLGLLALGRPRR